MQSVPDKSEWFLIDWKDAAFSPTAAAHHLCRTNHCSAVYQNNHGAEVDIWGVGELVFSVSFHLPESLKKLGRRLKNENCTAEVALKELEELKRQLYTNGR